MKLKTEELFHILYPRLCHFAFQLLGDQSKVEDVVQDAFVIFWEQRKRIPNHTVAIKNFLYTSVKNACFNILRHEKVKQRYIDRADTNAHEEAKALKALIRSEVMDEIHKAIQSLPEKSQQIFTMGYIEGLSNLKIAEQLGISINTVKTQKQRALKSLKERMNPELFFILLMIWVR